MNACISAFLTIRQIQFSIPKAVLSAAHFLPHTYAHFMIIVTWWRYAFDAFALALKIERKEWRIFLFFLGFNVESCCCYVGSTSGATRKTASEREAASLMPLRTTHVERSVWSLSASLTNYCWMLDGLCLVFLVSLLSETYIQEACRWNREKRR